MIRCGLSWEAILELGNYPIPYQIPSDQHHSRRTIIRGLQAAMPWFDIVSPLTRDKSKLMRTSIMPVSTTSMHRFNAVRNAYCVIVQISNNCRPGVSIVRQRDDRSLTVPGLRFKCMDRFITWPWPYRSPSGGTILALQRATAFSPLD
jgi:hypothetical protein